jgi:hypothetical protein
MLWNSRSFAALCLVAAIGLPTDAAVVSTANHYAAAPGDASLAAIVERLGAPSMVIDRQLAQTFVAGTTGTLQSITVTAGARNGAPVVDAAGLTVAFATVVNNQPSVIVASAPVQHVEVLASFGGPFSAPTVQQAVADFNSQEIVVEAGSTYAMIFSADSFGDSFMILGAQLSYSDGMMGG